MKELTKQRITAPVLALFPTAISFVMMIILNVIFEICGVNIDENELAFELMSDVPIGIAAALACILVKVRNKGRIKEAIHIKDFDISVPIMLAVFVWTLAEVSYGLSGLLLSNFMTIELNGSMSSTVAGVVSSVICASIFEEIIFRYAGTELAKGAYSMPLICIANGIYFAVVHVYNIQGFLNVFIGGVCAAYVYCKTRNILYTILEHAIHNALCYIPIGDFVYYEKNGFVIGRWYYIVINAVIAAACLVWYFKVFRKKYTKNYFEVNRETGLPYSEEVSEQSCELAAAV